MTSDLSEVTIPPEAAWQAWSPQELAIRLAGLDGWYIAGGWALDLWQGRQTREHEDLEFVVLREDVGKFRAALGDLQFFCAHDGQLHPLPAGSEPPAHIAQLWGWDASQACWRVDMMIEPGTPDEWVYKRDHAIRAPRTGMVAKTPEGIPYLAPPAVLLFKAKHRRDKDESDFRLALAELGQRDRMRLRSWLEEMHPGHAWIERLGEAP